MNFHTSTPLITPKPGEHALRRKSSLYKSVAQQLFLNNNSSKYRLSENDEVNQDHSSQFVNLPNGPSQDLFFGQRKENESSPSVRHTIPSIIVTEDKDIVSALKNCSISRKPSVNESTLKANDDTLTSRSSSTSQSDTPHGRRLSHITTTSPFSFEIREQEKRERKAERLLYQKHIEQMHSQVFKAKPAPKFKATSKVNPPQSSVKQESIKKATKLDGKISPKTTGVPEVKIKSIVTPIAMVKAQPSHQENSKQSMIQINHEREPDSTSHVKKVEMDVDTPGSSVTVEVTDGPKILTNKPTTSSIIQSNCQNIAIQSVKQGKIPVAAVAEIVNLDKATPSQPAPNIPIQVPAHDVNNHAKNMEPGCSTMKENTTAPPTAQKQFGKKDENAKSNHVARKPELWKKKPFQVSLPHRKLTIPVSPKLMTAQRARNREAFDERLREKERENIAKRNNPLRTVVPKRGPTEPLMSKYIKRPRHQI